LQDLRRCLAIQSLSNAGTAEWHERENAPFANPAPFVDRDMIFLLPDTASDITVEWVGEGDARTARIYPGRKLFAKLMNGAKPG
jgi:hypothetical protein